MSKPDQRAFRIMRWKRSNLLLIDSRVRVPPMSRAPEQRRLRVLGGVRGGLGLPGRGGGGGPTQLPVQLPHLLLQLTDLEGEERGVRKGCNLVEALDFA